MDNDTTETGAYPELASALASEHDLTYREEFILRLRFGLGVSGRPYTLDDIGYRLGVSRERVRQLQQRALAILDLPDLRPPHATRSLPLKDLWNQPAADLPQEADPHHRSALRKVVRDLLTERGDIELTFIQHYDSKVVHIIVPTELEFDTPTEKRHPIVDDPLLDWLVGLSITLCGYQARRRRGGFEAQGDQPVHEFPDERLCRVCVAALGPHSHRAFKHPQPTTADDRERR